MMKRGVEYEKRAGVDYVRFHGAITDPHMHPRIFDARLDYEAEEPNGKAGLDKYTKAALLGGIARGLAMGNESIRLTDPGNPERTILHPYPLTTVDRILAAASLIIQQSHMQIGINMLVDCNIIGLGDDADRQTFTAKYIRRIFSSPEVRNNVAALKIFGDESTGGFNIPPELVLPVACEWSKYNPGKPVIVHLEDEHVGEVAEEWPADTPLYVAHVSSQQELEPLIEQIENGKIIYVEATPHHLSLTSATKEALGGLGCMKPSLKSTSDVKCLWDNLKYIHVFGSDCAPHRPLDKLGPSPAFGVANHDIFMPFFLQKVAEGTLTEQELYGRIVENPRRIFNLPHLDAEAEFMLKEISAEEATEHTEYGCSPFPLSPESPKLLGKLMYLKIAGRLAVRYSRLMEAAAPSYKNLIQF